MCINLGIKKAPCTILSLGSRMEFSFEEEMLRMTPCQVHTFDCTVHGKSVDPQRHTFHRVCLGSKPERQNNTWIYKPYSQIIEDLGTEEVSLLKMDIERAEFEVRCRRIVVM